MGVASDIFGGCVMPDERPLVGQHGNVARKRLLRRLAVLVDHAALELSVAGDRELADDLLAAGLGGLHRERGRLGLAVQTPRLRKQSPELLHHKAIVPPPSGRLLRRKTSTFVPGNPLTPSLGSGPS